MPAPSHERVAPSLVRRILGAPALHFAAAGALWFVASRALDASASRTHQALAESKEIVVDAARIRGLRRDFALGNQQEADEGETRELVKKLVDEEILFREAVARGFDLKDRAIAYRLVQKMRFLDEDHGESMGELYGRARSMGLQKTDPVVRNILVEKMRLLIGRSAPEPTDAELAAFYEKHAADYQQGGRVTLRHLFFDKGRRGNDAAMAAAESAAKSAEGHGVGIADALRGDPFVMGTTLTAQSRNDLVKFFGPVFADSVMALPAGSWSAPIASTYGWHLVFVESRIEARRPELDEVRSRVLKAYEVEARRHRVDDFIRQLMPSYTVSIDEKAIVEQSRG